MGLDVARVSMEYLDRPSGAAYNFAYELMDDCEATGQGHAFGWFLKEQLQERAREYAESRSLGQDGQRNINDWIVLSFEW